MSYQVLARKWRPSEFSALIGQQAVVTALQNALRDGKVAQAYLFSGIRGVGKTTAARLFAKALNCEKGPEVGPCNDCPTCREITAGGDMDVLEIDAATYSKVEQVRELAESLKYGPARDRYKVVVLDEVHRLSRQAFDALLKIVEEPPPRLVFIFATTEADAVPATILSRCQEFHFRRVGATEVARHLAEICAAESIRASERALRLVARAGEGSVRDSVALLDQLATFGGGEILEQEAARLVGGLDLALFGKLLAAILAGDAAQVAQLAHAVEEEGWDPRQVHGHFLGYVKDALHLALAGGRAHAVDLPEEEASTLAELARGAGYENLLRLLHHLLSSESTIRRSDAASLALELAWLRAALLPKLIRVEELLAGGTLPAASAPAVAPGAAAAATSRLSTAARAEPAARSAPAAKSAPSSASVAAAPPRTETPPATIAPQREPPAAPAPAPAVTAPPARPHSGDPIERFRDELSARRPTLAALFADAELTFADGVLRIALSGSDSLSASQLGRDSNRALLDSAVVAIFGVGARWKTVEAERAPTPRIAANADVAETKGAARPGGAPPAQPVAHDPRVQAVLDIFGGSVAPAADARRANGADEPPPFEEELP